MELKKFHQLRVEEFDLCLEVLSRVHLAQSLLLWDNHGMVFHGFVMHDGGLGLVEL